MSRTRRPRSSDAQRRPVRRSDRGAEAAGRSARGGVHQWPRAVREGRSEGRRGQFRETLRLDSEFFPAAFYLGSCYAAGGRDHEAAGAWQTSLVTESDAPFIYTLLGDALLRLREIDAGDSTF